MIQSYRPTSTLIASLLLVVILSGCSSLGSSMNASPTLLNAMGIADISMTDLERTYTDEYSKYMAINGLNIHYRDIGEGPVIVLVHGIMSSLHTWNAWSDHLEKYYRVISLDVPGYGLTGSPENLDEFDVDFLISTFTRFVSELGLKRFDLAGNSLGGNRLFWLP